MCEIITIKSVAESHKIMGIEKPKHPLISVFRHTPGMVKYFGDIKITGDLYFISMKASQK